MSTLVSKSNTLINTVAPIAFSSVINLQFNVSLDFINIFTSLVLIEFSSNLMQIVY